MVALVVFVATAVLLGAVGDAAAQSRTPPPPTRVVFAIDNSGSMFGASGAQGSDPDEQRIEGVRNLIEVLRGFLRARDELRRVELGALSFGGDAPHVLTAPANVLVDALPARLRAEPVGGGTDFRGALCGAWALAAGEAPPASAGCPGLPAAFGAAAPAEEASRLLVVVITDGSPARGADEFAFDGSPPAADCPRGGDGLAGYESDDGDAYLCALASTWTALRAQRAADLFVIGLDEPGQWFPYAEAYWQRVAQCDGDGQPDCADRVVRSVEPAHLATLILGAFPGVDLCEAIQENTHTCDVPGGLVSVGFQIVGIVPGATTSVVSEAGKSYRSDDDPPELALRGDGAHVWRFERPVSGRWSVTGNGPASQRVIVEYDAARFQLELRQWDDDGLQLDLRWLERAHVASIEDQQYRIELSRQGSVVGNKQLRLRHEDTGLFSLTAPFAPPASANNAHVVTLYLVTATTEIAIGHLSLPAGSVGMPTPAPTAPPSTETATPPGTPTPMPTAAPSPAPTVPDCTMLEAQWEDDPSAAPRWEWALRAELALPPVRFRDSAVWTVVVGARECEEPIQASARIIDCERCSAAAAGRPPLSLSVPTRERPPGAATREWYAESGSNAEISRESVRLSDPWTRHWEPVWATGLQLLALLAFLGVSISFVSVRRLHAWRPNQEPVAPTRLAVPNEHHRLVDIVRLRAFVWRRTQPDEVTDWPGRLLMFQWLIVGPLVARDTSEGATRRARWLGDPIGTTPDAEVRLGVRRRSPRARR